jgi:hypothetical protein
MAKVEDLKKARQGVQGWLTRSAKELATVLDDKKSERLDIEESLKELNQRMESYMNSEL